MGHRIYIVENLMLVGYKVENYTIMAFQNYTTKIYKTYNIETMYIQNRF